MGQARNEEIFKRPTIISPGVPFPPYGLSREIAPEQRMCHSCERAINIGDHYFRRLKPAHAFCRHCGGTAKPYTED